MELVPYNDKNEGSQAVPPFPVATRGPEGYPTWPYPPLNQHSAETYRQPDEFVPSTPFPPAPYGPRPLNGPSTASFGSILPAGPVQLAPPMPWGPEPQQGTVQGHFSQAIVPVGQQGANTGEYPHGHGYGGASIMPRSGRRPRRRASTATAPNTLPLGRTAGVLELLTKECQARGFNPEWKIDRLGDFKYTCRVMLWDQEVQGNGEYYDPVEAKRAVAAKALDIVRFWPPGQLPPPQASRSWAPPPGNHPAIKDEEQSTMPALPWHQPAEHPSQPAGRVHRVRRAMTTSRPARSNDDASLVQAFLDGMAAGARIRENDSRARRSRSASPRATSRTLDGRRVRSSQRDRHRSNANPSSRRGEGRPRADKYRPNYRSGTEGQWVHDRYRP